MPVYSGTVTQQTRFGFPAWKNVSSIPGNQVWLSDAEVKADEAR